MVAAEVIFLEREFKNLTILMKEDEYFLGSISRILCPPSFLFHKKTGRAMLIYLGAYPSAAICMKHYWAGCLACTEQGLPPDSVARAGEDHSSRFTFLVSVALSLAISHNTAGQLALTALVVWISPNWCPDFPLRARMARSEHPIPESVCIIREKL